MATKIKLTRNVAHSFTKPLKLIADEMPEIIKRMLELSKSQDEKIALNALEVLVKINKDMVVERDKAELSKLIIKMKLGMAGGGQQQQSNVPQICFDTIQEV